jgi:hypothetical protein
VFNLHSKTDFILIVHDPLYCSLNITPPSIIFQHNCSIPLSQSTPTLDKAFTNSSPMPNIPNDPTILVYSSLVIVLMQKIWLLIIMYSSTIANAVNFVLLGL